jgi:hypothetical protein
MVDGFRKEVMEDHGSGYVGMFDAGRVFDVRILSVIFLCMG